MTEDQSYCLKMVMEVLCILKHLLSVRRGITIKVTSSA